MGDSKRHEETGVAKLRRMYIDCRYGQLHLTAAYPQSGGFDEARPLVYLHSEDGSGAEFNRCAALLGVDRSVYAPDLPGTGASDGPGGRPTLEGQAAGIFDLLEQLGLREVDVAGSGRGAELAVALAAARGPAIRRLVVAGLPAAAAAPAQALHRLSGGKSFVDGDAGAVVAEMRTFLDRA